MTSELSIQLLKEMEYTETPAPCCRNCVFFWDSFCTIVDPAVGLMSIKPEGRCNRFCVSK